MAHGHSHDFLGSGCVGNNFYPCFANITTNFGDIKCKSYVIDPFRVMGMSGTEFTNGL
jgi:hypothetical protein